jgi:hypothetical protein
LILADASGSYEGNMDDFTIFASEPDDLFRRVAAHYDAPAFARRARRVHEAFDELVERCRLQREEWLRPLRVQFKRAAALLHPTTSETVVAAVRRLSREIEIALPEGPVQTRPRRLRHELIVLDACIDRFNRRWSDFLERLDLSLLNRLREDYNRYYVLEKECALRSARLARLGFVPLQYLTCRELEAMFPNLPKLTAS